MNRGERIENKTKSSIKKALLELIQEKNYPDVTVSDIAERGNIGRSTIYKHYRSKADVLVDIHTDMFEQLFSGLSTAEAWLSLEPASELVLFFKKYKKMGKNPFLLSYKLGSDLDYLINNINLRLAKTIEKRIHASFSDSETGIPLSVLSQSVTSLFSGLIMSWFTQFQSHDIEQFAANIQRMSRAMIFEALKKET